VAGDALMRRAVLVLACAALLPAAARASLADSDNRPSASSSSASSSSANAYSTTTGAGLELNRILRRSRARTLAPADVAAAIVRLGRDALPPALCVLEERQLAAVDGSQPQALSEPQEEQLLDATRAMSAASVMDAVHKFLDHRGGLRAPVAARAAAVEVTGTCSTYANLAWSCGLFAPDVGGLDARVERVLCAAAREMLARDPRGYALLASDWRRLPVPTQAPVITACGLDGDARALSVLADVLEKRQDLAPIALAGLARQVAPDEVPRPLVDELRARLDPEQPTTCRAACNALAALGEFGAVAEMVGLLAHENDGIRSTAHQSLQALSGTRLPLELFAWRSWLANDSVWFNERHDPLRTAIESGTDAEAMDALAEISAHRWERHRLSQIALTALSRDERNVRLRACEVLRLLASPRSREALSHAAKDDDAEVAAAAARAMSVLPAVDAGKDAHKRTSARS
jgi:hypothetical protein